MMMERVVRMSREWRTRVRRVVMWERHAIPISKTPKHCIERSFKSTHLKLKRMISIYVYAWSCAKPCVRIACRSVPMVDTSFNAALQP